MKRSDMLKFIKHCIKTAAKGQEAHVVLDQIEAIGMLPPKYSACIITREPKERGELHIHDWEEE
jgi:hypothetical protein